MCQTCGKKSGWTLSTYPFATAQWAQFNPDVLTASALAPGALPVGGYLCTEGVPTGDKRMIAANALRWETPLPLRRVREDFGAHTGAVTVGAIEYVEREADGRLRWTGKLFDTEDGRAAYAEMKARYDSSGLKYGISVDLDDPEVEVDDDEMMTVTSARLRGATLCDIPAFHDAYGVIEDSALEEDADEAAPALVAAGVRQAPTAWFLNPNLTQPTALTVTPEGHVYGHIAVWGTCHIGFPGMCVDPPKSYTGYAYFRTGIVRTTDGDEIPTGRLTMDTGHASTRLTAKATVDHYDNTGMIAADLAAGEDKHGIWVSGALRNGVDADKAREVMATGVSGDWREIQGSLELVALLSVPVSGFPVPRARALAASGMMKALIATAVIEEAPVDEVTESVVEVPAVEAEAPVVEEAVEETAPVADVASDLASGGDEHNELDPQATTEIDDETVIPIEEPEVEAPVEEEPVVEEPEVVEEPPAKGVAPAVPAIEKSEAVEEMLKRLDGIAGFKEPGTPDLELLDRLAGV